MTQDTSPAREAERSTIGAAMLNSTVIDDVAEIITPQDMGDARHELIWAAVLDLHGEGVAPDIVSVSDRLGSDLTRCGGHAYLAELSMIATASASATHHAAIVAREATRRRVRRAAAQLAQDADNPEADPLDVINAARVTLDGLTAADDGGIATGADVFDAIESLEQPPGMPTPWPSMTKVIAGWKASELYIFGARPATGKTIVAQAVALDMARRGKHAYLASLEMSRDEMYLRMLSAVGSVDMGRIQSRSLTNDDHERLSRAATHIAGLPLSLDDRASLSVAQIRAEAKRIQRREELGVIVVDYLGLIRPADKRQDRRVQVDQISRDLKLLAKDLKVPVVAMSQLNRGSAGGGGPERKPMLSDLRESGAQEQDAGVVVLLHRDVADPVRSTELGMYIAKNRHGQTRPLTFDFQGHHSRITEPNQQGDHA